MPSCTRTSAGLFVSSVAAMEIHRKNIAPASTETSSFTSVCHFSRRSHSSTRPMGYNKMSSTMVAARYALSLPDFWGLRGGCTR